MELEAVKLLLESQERAFRIALDQMNIRIQTAEKKTEEVITSLEFSQEEISDLKREVAALRKQQDDRELVIHAQKQQIMELDMRSNRQEDFNRRNNLRLSGLHEQGETNWEQTCSRVAALLEDKLQLPGVEIEHARRVGPISSTRPRQIITTFTRYSDREAVLRNARKLKGTGVFVDEDLCAASFAEKMSKLPLLKKAREEGKIAFFRNTKLIIKERQFGSRPTATPRESSLAGVIQQDTTAQGTPNAAAGHLSQETRTTRVSRRGSAGDAEKKVSVAAIVASPAPMAAALPAVESPATGTVRPASITSHNRGRRAPKKN